MPLCSAPCFQFGLWVHKPGSAFQAARQSADAALRGFAEQDAAWAVSRELPDDDFFWLSSGRKWIGCLDDNKKLCQSVRTGEHSQVFPRCVIPHCRLLSDADPNVRFGLHFGISLKACQPRVIKTPVRLEAYLLLLHSRQFFGAQTLCRASALFSPCRSLQPILNGLIIVAVQVGVRAPFMLISCRCWSDVYFWGS